MSDETEVQTEPAAAPKQMNVLLASIIGIAIGAGGGTYLTGEAADSSLADQIAGAKHELVMETVTPEKIIEVTRDTVVRGDSAQVTTMDTLPAVVQPIMARFTPDIQTSETDTFVVSVTRKNGGTDTMMYYGVFCPPAGRTPVIKANFLDMGKGAE